MQVSLTSTCIRKLKVTLYFNIPYVLPPPIKMYIKNHTRNPASQSSQLNLTTN